MTDAPIMMPMQPDAAAQQMLIEQVRRLSDSVDRFNTTMSNVQQQLARMETENRHTVERRDKNEARLSRVEDQIGRASCRERGGQYVEIGVVAGALKKKSKTK